MAASDTLVSATWHGSCRAPIGLRPGDVSIQVARLAASTLVLLMAVLVSVAGLASPAHADAIRDKQWHLDFLKAVQLHKITKGKGVAVAVVDSGVDGNHPDLNRNVLEGADFSGDGNAWKDASGHGTAMASLIAGHGHGPDGHDGVLGLAPDAKILPSKVKFKDGEISDTDDALEWVVDQRIGVMSMSFGGSGGISRIEKALAEDIVVVAAAGNTEQDQFQVAAPAAYPGVIAVSGVDRNGRFTEKSVQGPEVVLAAPMMEITAAWAGRHGPYATGSGTSDAAAIVSGVAALIRAKYPDISANGVINRMIKTADDKGPPGRDDKYGFGVINPLKALTADIPDIDYNPLIEGAGPAPSPSAKRSDPAAKPGNEQDEDIGYLLPVLAGAAALVVIAGLATYFLVLARRSRYSLGPNDPTKPYRHRGGP